MGHVTRLRTKAHRLKQDQAAELRQALLPFADAENPAMATTARRLISQLDADTAAANGWTFVMISPKQNGLVVEWLIAKSSRPMVAVRLWALLFEHLDHSSCAITASRGDIAKALGVRPDHVSSIMTELEQLGAISRERRQGRVTYYLNPLVGSRMGGMAREKAQAAAPELRLVPTA